MNIVVTGAAGFIGLHLCRALLRQGHEVFGIDNFYSGKKDNVDELSQFPNFKFVEWDVRNEIDLGNTSVDQLYHLACPASPVHYQKDPIYTLDTCYLGTKNVLQLGLLKKVVVLVVSTSEVYGDAELHPQQEVYRGNVNTWGPRSCYDEGKRVIESLAYEFHHFCGLEVRVPRIFNTYGPHMNQEDGRVMTNLILSALKQKPMTIYGTGQQTRSFCFVSDTVDGLIRLMNSSFQSPVNLGNPEEVSILQVADMIKKIARSDSPYLFLPLPSDDPKRRCPDITLARKLLQWSPRISLREGLEEMIHYYERFV